MKFRWIQAVLILCLAFAGPVLYAQNYSFSGKITDKETGEPVEFATIALEGSGQWAVANAGGEFTIKNVPAGKNTISVSCLGYVTQSMEITVSKDVSTFKIALYEDNLTLESVVVTAKENENSATTNRTIDKAALDHVQILDVVNVSSLLPGGATVNPALTGEQNFNIRSGKSESGNASFGTAVEVDGVRLSSNASFSGADATSTNVKGVATNNIASSNVESVEVITGVPSVEYGDMTSGIVKINTRKGKTPYTATFSTTPNNKQFSLSKGFGLGSNSRGASRGVLNASAEYTRSVSELMSPYTSYLREQLSLTYSNLLSRGFFEDKPLRYSFSLTGNLGGLDNSADPDLLKDTYTRTKDNALRGNVTVNWLLNKSWITNVELNASASYSDKFQSTKDTYSSAVSSISLHGRERGYYIAAPYAGDFNPVTMIAPGYWYNTMYLDDKPFTYKITLKANWSRNIGKVNNKIKLGADLSADKNFGIGEYSEEMATAPTFREYRYCDVPWMTSVSPYLENNLMIPVGKDGRINLIAGLRYDNTIIKGSEYGITSSLSPRFNAKYTVFTDRGRRHEFVKELAFRGSWGIAVKQPSFSILYPHPSYFDINVFTSTASSDNTQYRGYFIMPRTIEYNPALRWQNNRQAEVGMDINLGGAKVSLAAFYNKTRDSYRLLSDYEAFSWKNTTQASVQGLEIPADRRNYSIDGNGVITVSDRNGEISPITAPYQTKNQLITRIYEDNDDNPITRYGVEWVVEFPKIKAIGTTVRLDGTYYGYRELYTDMVADSPCTTTGSDGNYFKYVGYYYGDNDQSNGMERATIRNNITITTHIPQVRLIFSVKLESTLLSYSRALSERLDGSTRSYVLAEKGNLASFCDGSIYDGDVYAVLFPDTYSSIDNLGERRDFMTDFLWAKQNDRNMYNDLCRLASSTAYTYIYKKDYISPYFCVNFNVTKEIGDMTSISFYANNFLNNAGQVYSTKTETWSSLSSLIPNFYYGLTLRLKF